jgi:hypothetical protein
MQKNVEDLLTVAIIAQQWNFEGKFFQQFNQCTFINQDTVAITINGIPVPGGASLEISLNSGEINKATRFTISSASANKSVMIIYTIYTQYTQ